MSLPNCSKGSAESPTSGSPTAEGSSGLDRREAPAERAPLNATLGDVSLDFIEIDNGGRAKTHATVSVSHSNAERSSNPRMNASKLSATNTIL